MAEYHITRAREIVSSILYATIATSTKNGKPWNSPVAFFHDSGMNIYWFSDKDSVHSSNIRKNPNVFIVIYDSTMAEGTGEGLYIEAVAHEVSNEDEVRKVAALQTGAMKVDPELCMGEAVHRFYVAKPVQAWMNDDEKNDDGNYVKDIRVEVPLEKLKGAHRE